VNRNSFTSQKEVVDWLLELVNPRIPGATTKHRLRNRLYQARKRNEIPQKIINGVLHLEDEAVFLWAGKQEDLRDLVEAQFPQYSRKSTNVKVTGVTVDFQTGPVVAIGMPKGEKAKEEKIIELERKIQLDLAPKAAELKSLKERRKDQRKYGKEGGRGKSK